MVAPDFLSSTAEVARLHRTELVAVARREGLGAEDAVDCVQDALCTFLKLGQRGELPANPVEWAPFLAGVTRNAARNKRRRHHLARPHAPVDADAGSVEELDAATAEALIAAAEEHVRLRSCVDRLCDTQKAVVMLRMLDERPGDDVASALGIRRGHVDVLLHRAKAQLRVCMMENDEAHGPSDP
jgi:RNA polymerase sigma-70 factor (ECF subfamily)